MNADASNIEFIDLDNDDSTSNHIESIQATTGNGPDIKNTIEIIEIVSSDLENEYEKSNELHHKEVNTASIVNKTLDVSNTPFASSITTRSDEVNMNFQPSNRTTLGKPDLNSNFLSENDKSLPIPNAQSGNPFSNILQWLTDEDDDNEAPHDNLLNDTIESMSQPESSYFHQSNAPKLAERAQTVSGTSSRPDSIKPKAKPSKTEITNVSSSGFHYSAKDLKEANRVTRKKEDIFKEIQLSVGAEVYTIFEPVKDEFMSVLQNGGYNLPIMLFKRMVNADYDETQDIFVPCKPKQILEKTIVFIYKANELFAKIKNRRIESEFSNAVEWANMTLGKDHRFIVAIEGYDQLLSKIRAHEQRNFKNQVLSNITTTTESQQKRARSNFDAEISEYPSSKDIDYFINKLQIRFKVNFFMVRTLSELVSWLNSFTYTVGSSLYDKHERNKDLSNLGMVKSGSDTKSTFLRSLQHFPLMTSKSTDLLYLSHTSMRSIHDQLINHGTLGKDSLKRNIVPPSVDRSMSTFFKTNDPNKVIN